MRLKVVLEIMLTLLFLSMFMSTFQAVLAQPPSKEWTKTYGSKTAELATSVVQTSDGGYAIAGLTGSHLSNEDFWLVKTDAMGIMEWNQTYGGSSPEYAFSLAQTSDGGYVVAGGILTSPMYNKWIFWLVKTNVMGHLEWKRTYGQGKARSVIQTNDGGYAMVGNARLVKTDALGHMEWNRTYGRVQWDEAYSVVQTSDGGYAIVTESWDLMTLIKTDTLGQEEWSQRLRLCVAQSLILTSDGGFAMAGWTRFFGDSSGDFWLGKTDAMGVMEWNQSYGGSSPEDAFSLVQTSDGGFVIAGSTMSFGSGADDFWIVKTDSVGTMEWNKTFGGPTIDSAYSMIQTSDGGYAIAGGTYSFGAGGSDFLLVKLAPEVTWEYIFEDQYRETVLKISTDDKLFQFVAPNKEFLLKHDPNMHLWKFRSSMIIAISYKDADIRLIANIVDSSFDFCFANVRDSHSGERYLLISRLYSGSMPSCGSRSTVMK